MDYCRAQYDLLSGKSLPSLGSGQADHAREEYPQGNEIDTIHNYFEAWLDKLSESHTLLTHSYQF